MEARLFQVQANYNINLYTQLSQSYHKTPLAEQIIANDVQMDENGRIFILTGPNQGGKTTYIQAIGLTQLLAQAGLWVPGSQATISPVDAIYTHFPLEEQLERGTGRFGDEAQRLNEIFQEATPHSLVLLNESLASTAVGESIYLAQDIVRIMRLVGLRAIFATHFHELAETADQLNADTPGSSAIVSLVASRIDTTAPDQATALRRSYHIQPGPPMGRSFARELAQKYGMSYEQLTDMLAQRGIIQNP
jgi:DNA mismatch repair ATPase MutS